MVGVYSTYSSNVKIQKSSFSFGLMSATFTYRMPAVFRGSVYDISLILLMELGRKSGGLRILPNITLTFAASVYWRSQWKMETWNDERSETKKKRNILVWESENITNWLLPLSSQSFPPAFTFPKQCLDVNTWRWEMREPRHIGIMTSFLFSYIWAIHGLSSKCSWLSSSSLLPHSHSVSHA